MNYGKKPAAVKRVWRTTTPRAQSPRAVAATNQLSDSDVTEWLIGGAPIRTPDPLPPEPEPPRRLRLELLALRAWRRRGDLSARDPLWHAAVWERAIEESPADLSTSPFEDWAKRAAELVKSDPVALQAIEAERKRTPRQAGASLAALRRGAR